MSSSSDSSDESSDSDESNDEDEVWIEKNADGQFRKPDAVKSSKSKKSNDDGADDESQVGPSVRNTSGLSHKDFGHALLPGEGAAMVNNRFQYSNCCCCCKIATDYIFFSDSFLGRLYSRR